MPASPPEMRGWTNSDLLHISNRSYCISRSPRKHVEYLFTGELITSQRGCATLDDALWLITRTYWRARDLAAHKVKPYRLVTVRRTHLLQENGSVCFQEVFEGSCHQPLVSRCCYTMRILRICDAATDLASKKRTYTVYWDIPYREKGRQQACNKW